MSADGVFIHPQMQVVSLKVAREELNKAIALMERTKMDEMSSHPDDELTPAQIAVLKRQLEAANERLLAVERRRQELQDLHCDFDGPIEARRGGRDG